MTPGVWFARVTVDLEILQEPTTHEVHRLKAPPGDLQGCKTAQQTQVRVRVTDLKFVKL